MAKRDDILSTIQQRGPLLPAEVKEYVKDDLYIIGAFLSELVHSKLLQTTHAKIGGSPLYFVPNQREQLHRLRDHLNQKDKEIYDILYNDLVINDEQQSAVHRAGLRNLKDFAVPLNVTIQGTKQLFWKWHLTSNDQAIEIIKKQIKPIQTAPKPEPIKEIKEEETQEQKDEAKPVIEKKPEPKTEKTIIQKEKKEPETQHHLIDKSDPLLEKVTPFLEKHNITLKELEIIKAKKELAIHITFPTSLGDQHMLCYIKDKKKCNDADLSTAYLHANLKNLPPLFITTGELTKKAQDIIKDLYKGMLAIEKV